MGSLPILWTWSWSCSPKITAQEHCQDDCWVVTPPNKDLKRPCSHMYIKYRNKLAVIESYLLGKRKLFVSSVCNHLMGVLGLVHGVSYFCNNCLKSPVSELLKRSACIWVALWQWNCVLHVQFHLHMVIACMCGLFPLSHHFGCHLERLIAARIFFFKKKVDNQPS